MNSKIKIISFILCIAMIAMTCLTVVGAAPSTLTGATSVQSENIYVNGVDTGAKFTQYKIAAGNTYSSSSSSVINVVEVESANPNTTFAVLNCGSYLYNRTTMGTAAITYNNSHAGTVIAATNGDPWLMYHNDYDGDGSRSTGPAGKKVEIPRSLMIVDGELYNSAMTAAENYLANKANSSAAAEYGTTPSSNYAFGVCEDGSFVIGKPTLTFAIKNITTNVSLNAPDGINRLSAPNATMVYNHRIGTESLAYTDAYEIYLRTDNSAFGIGADKVVTGTVTAIFESDSTETRPSIDANTIVISARGTDVNLTKGKASVGDQLTITVGIRTDAYLASQRGTWANVTNAIGGFFTQIEKGQVTGQPSNTSQYPCPMIGLTEDGDAMMISVTAQSEGVYRGCQMKNLSALCQDLGLYTVLMFDGGGSAQFITYEDGAYIRRASSSDGLTTRPVTNGLALVYTGADVQVTNKESVAKSYIDGVANNTYMAPTQSGGGTTETPTQAPSETPTEPETPTGPSVDLPTPDITGSPISNYRYYSNIDFINGTGPDGTSSPYLGITSKRGGSSASLTTYTLTGGLTAQADGKVTITGWAVINGGQGGHYWSVDGTNWYACTGGSYNLNMSNWDAIKAVAMDANGAAMTESGIKEDKAKFTNIEADLSAFAGTTTDVYFGLGNYNNSGVALMVKIEDVTIPKSDHTCTPGAAATCTTAQTCTSCGKEINPALGHDWTAANCTTPKTCTRCQTADGSPLGHTWTAATCTTPKTCSVCNTTEGTTAEHTWVAADCTTPKTCSVCETIEGTSLGHQWIDATCTEAKTCDRCQVTEGEALGHNEQSFDAQAPTCTQIGWDAYVDCTRCEYTTYEEISATGHTWAGATCDSPRECSVCHDTDGQSLGHDWADATCILPKTCERCGETDGDALGHDWTAATCTAPKTCDICGETEGDANGHTWLDATCTAPKTCDVCDATEGNPLGHDWKAATCTEPKTCKRCNITEGNVIAHSYANATCTAPKTCTVCGATSGSANGHTWANATCTAPKTCSVCGATEGNANGHTWIDATCTTPETCETCGKTTGEALGHSFAAATCTSPKICAVCEATEGNALGHDWAGATCAEVDTCERCGETQGEALGHNWIEATCVAPKYCDRCRLIEGTALGHNWVGATCTESNSCDRCSATMGKPLGHSWADATCTAPKTCAICELTEGEALGHDWIDATCTSPKTCDNCGEMEGTSLDHDYTAATCTTPKTCKVCAATEGTALGHDWAAATCVAPKTCQTCAKTEGTALGHDWTDATCTSPKTCDACGATDGEALGHNWTPANCTSPKTCGVCQSTEGVALGHAWDNDCDKTCNNGCGETRTTSHVYDNETDKDCNVCGDVREVATEAPTTPVENDTQKPTEPNTEAPTEEPTAPVEEPTEGNSDGEDEGGCRSVAGMGIFAMVSSIALAGYSVFKKKK